MKKLNELIIAHRGESFDAPENTISAINLAWQRDIKSVEIDIHLTKDNEIVVIHDKNTLKVTGVKKKISDTTLGELKLLDAGSFKGSKWNNERIPTLQEVLTTVPADGKLIIEIKATDRIVRRLKEELTRSNLSNSQIEIIAFNEKTLAKARDYMPEYKMLWLLDLDYFWPWWLYRINTHEIISKIKELHFDGINVWAGKLLNKEFIDTFKYEKLLIYAWTINDPVKAQQLLSDGIDGITTDRASWLMQHLI